MTTGRRALLLAAVVSSALAGVAAAGAGTTQPQPKPMALTAEDLGHGAVVESQRFVTSGAIPTTRGYQRSFTGITLGKARLFTLQHTVLIGKAKADAAKLVSSILLAASSKAGREALYREAEKSFAESSRMDVRRGAVTRAGELKAGDAAVEIVFRFETESGSYQVGEIFMRVGGNLSTIFYGAGIPGVSEGGAKRLALTAAAHMKDADPAP
jgi:hypothetical protein